MGGVRAAGRVGPGWGTSLFGPKGDESMSHLGQRVRTAAAVVLICSAPAGAGEAGQVFESLYGKQVRSALATRDRADDAALAGKLLEAAKGADVQPELVAVLCEKAHLLGSRAPAGHEAALEAMELLAARAPARRAAARQKALALHQRRYNSSRGADRLATGEALTAYLVRLADEAKVAGDYAGAVGFLRRGLAVAGSIRSAEAGAIRAGLKELAAEQRIATRIKTLEARLATKSDDMSARQQLIEVLLIERDDPAEAAKRVTAACGEELRTYVPLAAKPADNVEPAACLELGDWYRRLADKSAGGAKVAMLCRARGWYQAFLARHEARDLRRTKGELALKQVGELLAKLGGPTNGAPGGKAGSRLSLVTRPARVEGAASWTIETRTLRGRLDALAVSRDGRQVAVAGHSGAIRLLDAGTGRLAGILIGHDDQVGELAFLPDGKTLASGGHDGTIRFWDAATGRALRTVTVGGPVRAMALSPDGAVAAVARGAEVALYDGRTGRMVGRLRGGHAQPVTAVDWSPDGRWIASGGGADDGTTCLWDARRKVRRQVIRDDIQAVGAVAFSPDSRSLAVTEATPKKGCLVIWDIASKKAVRKLTEPVDASRFVRWSPDGSRLACQSEGKRVQIWETASWTPRRALVVLPAARKAAWFPDGRQVAVCGGELSWGNLSAWAIVRDVESGQAPWQLKANSAQMTAMTWSHATGRLACGHEGNQFGIQIWDVASASLTGSITSAHAIQILQWSPDGGQLASSSRDDDVVRVWDPASGSTVQRLDFSVSAEEKRPAGGMTWSPKSKRVVAVPYFGGPPVVCDSRTGKAIGRLKGYHSGWYGTLAWSPNGMMIALSGKGEGNNLKDGKNLAIWRADTGRYLGLLEGPGSMLSAVDWAPDSRKLVTGSDDAMALIWSVRSRRPVKALPGVRNPVQSVAWSPNGTWIAAGEGHGGEASPAVRMWSARSLKLTASLGGHPGDVHSLAWSRDGRTLVSASERLVRFWEAATGRPKLTLMATGQADGVAFGADGHYRLSGEVDAEKEFVYVVRTAKGQAVLTPSEFSKKYRWANDPSKVVP